MTYIWYAEPSENPVTEIETDILTGNSTVTYQNGEVKHFNREPEYKAKSIIKEGNDFVITYITEEDFEKMSPEERDEWNPKGVVEGAYLR